MQLYHNACNHNSKSQFAFTCVFISGEQRTVMRYGPSSDGSMGKLLSPLMNISKNSCLNVTAFDSNGNNPDLTIYIKKELYPERQICDKLFSGETLNLPVDKYRLAFEAKYENKYLVYISSIQIISPCKDNDVEGNSLPFLLHNEESDLSYSYPTPTVYVYNGHKIYILQFFLYSTLTSLFPLCH